VRDLLRPLTRPKTVHSMVQTTRKLAGLPGIELKGIDEGPTNPLKRGGRSQHSFAQSTSTTVIWSRFLILAGKAAAPVLVMSVLYTSVQLLPQYDVVVFIAQFVALDIGGLGLNKGAERAKQSEEYRAGAFV
jgi:hypothetical protein